MIAKMMLWAQPLGVTAGCVDLLPHSLPLLTGQVERRWGCWKPRSDKENNSVYRRGWAPGVRPGPPASNTYLFALVNWELSVGIPLSLLLETAFLLFSPPTSLQIQLESCVSVSFSTPGGGLRGPLFRSPRV